MKASSKKIFSIVMIIAMVALMVFALVACDKGNSKPVVVVGYTVYEPMNYTDANGTLVGFDTELAQKVFSELGYQVVFKEINWSNKYVDLNNGNISCIWNGFTSNSDDGGDGILRSEKVDFTYNYMLNAQAVVVKSANASAYTDKATSFNSKRGAYEVGSAGASYFNEFTGAVKKEAIKQMDAITQVKTGASEFAIVDYLLAKSIVGKGDYSDLTQIESLKSAPEYYAIGFKKGSSLTAQVNAKILKYAQDGSLLQLATKYNLQNTIITDYTSQIGA